MPNSFEFFVSKLPKLASLVLLACIVVLPLGCSRQNRDGSAGLPEASLTELNSALDSWMMMKGTMPQNVSDLTNFPALRTKRLPVPPPGKKLILDPATRQVVFADQ